MNFKNIIRQIAKEHGVTPAEVKKDMQDIYNQNLKNILRIFAEKIIKQKNN